MTAEARVDETRLRAAYDAGDLDTVIELALEAYGDEIAGFLAAYLHSSQEAEEVFAVTCEHLWQGLPTFEWRTTLRAWAYTIARHAAIRHKTVAYRKPGRNIALSDAKISRMVDDIRSRTALYLRTETKSRMQELREQLPDDEQSLLILRVDRGLSWRELSEVLHTEGSAPEDPMREEARLRKRFQLVKEKLRQMAKAEGLLD